MIYVEKKRRTRGEELGTKAATHLILAEIEMQREAQGEVWGEAPWVGRHQANPKSRTKKGDQRMTRDGW